MATFARVSTTPVRVSYARVFYLLLIIAFPCYIFSKNHFISIFNLCRSFKIRKWSPLINIFSVFQAIKIVKNWTVSRSILFNFFFFYKGLAQDWLNSIPELIAVEINGFILPRAFSKRWFDFFSPFGLSNVLNNSNFYGINNNNYGMQLLGLSGVIQKKKERTSKWFHLKGCKIEHTLKPTKNIKPTSNLWVANITH